MRLLIIGASGYLGGALYHHLGAAHEVTGTFSTSPQPGLRYLDMRVPAEVHMVVGQSWDLILCVGALVDMRTCSENRQLAWEVNVDAIRTIVGAANTKIIYFSTDNVFDGRKPWYLETDTPAPLSEYGRTKRAAERIILDAAPGHLVIRIPFLYGWSPYRDAFFARFKRPVTPAPHPMRFNPLYLPDLANLLDDLCRLNGIVHFGGATETTRYDFYNLARTILELPTTIVSRPPVDVFGNDERPESSVLRSCRTVLCGRAAQAALEDLRLRIASGTHQ